MDQTKKTLILGAGLHGQHIAAMLSEDKTLAVQAVFLDDADQLHDRQIAGCHVLGSLAMVEDKSLESANFILGIGNSSLQTREKIFTKASKILIPVNSIHSSAIVSVSAHIGIGNVFFPLVVINPFATVGNNCVVYTGSVVEHHCRIDANAWLSPGVHLGGNTCIGENTFIGIGASISSDIKIGNNCVVGAGAVVLQDVPDNTIVAGVPAKKVKDRNP